MKKLLFFIGILSLSLTTFGQYTEDKLPSGLTVTTSLAANDYQIVQKTGESYVKAIKAYHAYLYYKKMLDSIVNLSISGNFHSTNVSATAAVFSANIVGTNVYSTDTAIFGDEIYIYDTLHFFNKTYLPEWGYAMVLDTTDSIVKLAPMPDGIPDFNNVAYVNYDLTGDLESQLIFDSYASAAVWINANGSPAADNHWTIVMPSGYCDEDVELVEFIDLQGMSGSKVKSVVSTTISTGSNFNDCKVENIEIDTIYFEKNTIISVKNCTINHLVNDIGEDAYIGYFENNIIYGTPDFTNINFILGANKCSFFCENLETLPSFIISSLLMIDGAVIDNETTFVLCGIKGDSITFEEDTRFNNCVVNFSGDIILNDLSKSINTAITADSIFINVDLGVHGGVVSGTKIFTNSAMNICNATLNAGDVILNGSTVINFMAGTSIWGGSDLILNDNCEVNFYSGFSIVDNVINNDPSTVTINDYRNTIAGSSEAASINNVGKLRYREDANNSYLEQVMKTGASTYAWVVVKTNTW